MILEGFGFSLEWLHFFQIALHLDFLLDQITKCIAAKIPLFCLDVVSHNVTVIPNMIEFWHSLAICLIKNIVSLYLSMKSLLYLDTKMFQLISMGILSKLH